MTDGESDELVAWSLNHDRCACCWIPDHKAQFLRWPGLQTHHLVKRSRRVCHEPWNLLRLCERCHRLAELHCIRVDGEPLPHLTFAVCLGLKREAGPAEWEPAKLAELYGSPLPEIKSLPPVFVAERHRHRPLMMPCDILG